MIRSRMMTILVVIAVAAGVRVQADPTPIGPFNTKDFSSFQAVSEVGSLLSSAYNFNNTFVGTISSSVWQLSGGNYLYLYQAANSGPSALEELGVAPFYQITEVGAVTSGVPSEFLAGGKMPLQYPAGSGNYSVTYDNSAANVTFGYLGFFGGSMPAGQHTSVLYLISPNAPVKGTVYAMDSGVGYAEGWTSSVPEPGSLTLFGMGASMLLALRRKQR